MRNGNIGFRCLEVLCAKHLTTGYKPRNVSFQVPDSFGAIACQKTGENLFAEISNAAEPFQRERGSGMQCQQCGYMMSPFDATCPRCVLMAQRPPQPPVFMNRATPQRHVRGIAWYANQIAKWCAAVWSVLCLLGLLIGFAKVAELDRDPTFHHVPGEGNFGVALGVALWVVIWLAVAGPCWLVFLLTRAKADP
ncbi:MAG: hypothetical protein JWN14_1702 [Chthonomonadales bacterium]|nr:hypothetical protein [Chthonomonadales bacterium]